MTVPLISDLPTPPSRSDSPATFASLANPFLGAFPTLRTQYNAQSAALDVLATTADAAVADALSGTNAAEWVTGTTYARGDKRWSPINFKTYRRKTNGAGSTDPSADSTNWALIVGTGDVKRTATQTLENKTLESPVIEGSVTNEPYTITDGASVDIDPDNGAVQEWTIGANRTPTADNFQDGQRVRLRIARSGSFSITWTSILEAADWVDEFTPPIPASGFALVSLFKFDGRISGAYIGDVA
jgi:hypothetical protein